MLYTQQQAVALAGLDPSTFVYWMRAVPRVARLKGRGARFAHADVVALSVLAVAVRELGSSIGDIQPIVGELFALLHGCSTEELRQRAVIFDVRTVSLERLPFTASGTNAVAIIPLQPMVMRLFAPESSDQYALPL